ncbi:leucine-zipper-like transcriptional regulator 1 [Anaeramoeba ignava]|uniref:Leucine-zipper-like transcriptional regulator 1 n=1 Tax=Anaeramoeba ignava TaxID=1746090 RepID=A0A9Q0R5V7_ANAIG|nr:leucine-zipper-like transcriptional regulator 1 [Anaeramoeba ignava]
MFQPNYLSKDYPRSWHSFEHFQYTSQEYPDEVFPQKRVAHSSVIYKEKMYIFSGFQIYSETFSDLYSYDLIDKKWKKEEQYGEIPYGRNGHSAIVAQDLMWIFGGADENEIYLNELYSYNFETKMWKKEQANSQFPSERVLHSAFLINEKEMAIFGGVNQQGNLLFDLNIFNFETKIWRTIQNTPKMNDEMNCFLFENRLYAFDDSFKKTFTFDFLNEEWSDSIENEGSFPKVNMGVSFSVIGNAVFIFGGFPEPKSDLSKLYLYYPHKHQFVSFILDDTPISRYKHSASVYQTENETHVLIFGGIHKEETCFNELHEYTFPKGFIPYPTFVSAGEIFEEKIYIYGGMGVGEHTTRALIEYNIEEKRWREIKTTGEIVPALYGAGHLLYKDCMLIYGGIVDEDISNTFYALDLRKFEWRILASGEKCPRLTLPYLFSVQDTLFLVGSQADTRKIELYRFDFTSKNFESLLILGNDIEYEETPPIVFHQNKLFVLLGKSVIWASFADPSKTAFEPQLIQLEPSPQMKILDGDEKTENLARTLCTPVVVNDKIFVYSGLGMTDDNASDLSIVIDLSEKTYKLITKTELKKPACFGYLPLVYSNNTIILFGGGRSHSFKDSNILSFLQLEPPPNPIFSDFEQLRQSQETAQTVFSIHTQTGRKEFKIHDAVLLSRCKKWDPNIKAAVISLFEIIGPDLVDHIFHFIYSAQISDELLESTSFDNLCAIFSIALTLGIDFLRRKCEQILIQNHLNISTCLELLVLFDSVESKNSKNSVLCLIAENQESLFAQFEQISKLSSTSPHLTQEIEACISNPDNFVVQKEFALGPKQAQTDFIEDMSKLFDSQRGSNFIINAYDLDAKHTKPINTHRDVLYARSELYRGMFISVMDESNSVTDMSNRSYKAVYSFVKYLYTGDLDQNLEISVLNELLDAWIYYGLTDNHLQLICQERINQIENSLLKKNQLKNNQENENI